jgi:hypothetical protein
MPDTWFTEIAPFSDVAEDVNVNVSRHEHEGAARNAATFALLRGSRVSAGTLEGVRPMQRIREHECLRWAFGGGLIWVEHQRHAITFTSDAPELQLADFAEALNEKFMSAGEPSECKAWWRKEPNGYISVFLSPAASNLVRDMRPLYSSKMIPISIFSGDTDLSDATPLLLLD